MHHAAKAAAPQEEPEVVVAAAVVEMVLWIVVQLLKVFLQIFNRSFRQDAQYPAVMEQEV